MSLTCASSVSVAAKRADAPDRAPFDGRGIIRLASMRSDLQTVNTVVEQALLSWRLSERVYRLALPSLRYDVGDLEHMQFVIADDAGGEGVGVAVWEAADRREAPAGAHALLLHGLYVIPRCQGCGTGTRLLEFVQSRAAAHGFDGIVLRAWRESEAFFRARGFSPLAADQAVDRHPLRLWRPSA